MIIRNGIRSILRSRKLCILFFLLIFVLSMILTLGQGVFLTAGATLKSFEETYQTVGRIEYIGEEYPDETAADEAARQAYQQLDLDSLLLNDGILAAEKKQFSLGYTEGYTRWNGDLPYKNYGVLIIHSPHPITYELTEQPLEGIPDFPEKYILSDTVTGMLTVVNEGMTWRIPRIFSSREEETLRQYVYENGILSEITYVSVEELPQLYVLVPEYGNETVVGWDGSFRLDDRSIRRYTYNPETGEYGLQTYTVSEYSALLTQCIYARNDDGRKIQIRLRPGSYNTEFEEDHSYIVHGSFVDANTSNKVFELRPFESDEALPYKDITDSDTDTGLFEEYAAYYQIVNNRLNVYFSENISLLEEFHQGYLTLEEGRFPESAEDHACVIDRTLAKQLGLEVNDSLPVQLLSCNPENFYSINNYGEASDYRITGITCENSDYAGCVFINGIQENETAFFGFQLGFLQFENASARSTAEQISEYLPENCRLVLYDQGYETNSQPLYSLRTTAIVIIVIASLCALSALILFAFLYIYRQKETVVTLHQLGMSRKQIRRWMLAGVLAVVSAASFCGSLTAACGESAIIRLTVQNTASLYSSDTRYSEAGIGLCKTMETVVPSPLTAVILCMAAVILAAVIFSLLFLQLCMNENRPARGKSKIHLPEMRTSAKGNSIFRYGFIGFFRSENKSRAVILITFLLSSLLCFFYSLSDSYEKKLQTLYDETEITGSIVSLNGRYYSGLVIPADTVRQLNQSSYIEEFHVCANQMHWWLENEIPAFSDTGFGQESKDAWIQKQPSLIFADSLMAAEDFLYTPAVITWADGYDESFLNDEYPFISESYTADRLSGKLTPVFTYPAIIPDQWAKQYGLSLSDTFEIIASDIPFSLKIAGVYKQVTSKANLYMPLNAVYNPQDLLADSESTNTYRSFAFTSGRFRLKSAKDLSAFKDYLYENNYSQVNRPSRNRTAIVLDDASFLDTENTLRRHIAFANTVYPILISFTILIGFIISWLMINGRRMDFAILRGLGTGKFKVFAIFLIEQAIAVTIGVLPAVIISAILIKPWLPLLFYAAYLAGTAIAILLIMKENLLILLLERE